MVPRLPVAARHVGPAAIVLLVAGYAFLWLAARPGGEPTRSYIGQLSGAEAVLLLSIGLVLISMLPWVEVWFDGIDRAAIWHRRVAVTGLVLLLPHVLLSSNPNATTAGPALGVIGIVGMLVLASWAILPRWRSVVPESLRSPVVALGHLPGNQVIRSLVGGYDRWRALHRTTGIFVAAGFLHGVLDGTPFPQSPVLRWTYVAVGGIGLAFYAYRELLARYFLSLHDYEVDAVSEVETGLVEVALRPLGRRMDFAPGQFAMVYLEAKDGWHRHPFTIASAPKEGILRVTVKGLGDYTSRLQDLLEPGMPAVIGGPHGRFLHEKGTDRQVWIAGGVGLAPFLSWLRSLDEHPTPGCVDFFYSASDSNPPFAEEIQSIVGRHHMVSAHVIDTSTEGRLTTERVLATAGGEPRTLSVFLCGPEGMLRDFQVELRRAGVPARHIHREYFDWR